MWGERERARVWGERKRGRVWGERERGERERGECEVMLGERGASVGREKVRI